MRRNYVLRRMYDLGHIDDLTYQTEKSLPMQVRRVVEEDAPANANASADKVTAHFAAELARMMMFDIFGDETYSRGINVYTTIRMDEQRSAVDAVRRQLITAATATAAPRTLWSSEAQATVRRRSAPRSPKRLLRPSCSLPS